MERIREVWDKMDPEGAGALSYASLKRILDDLEIDWVRTAPPDPPSERHLELPRVARISPPPPTPATVEPSPPDAAHLRPSPRSPRAVS